MHTTQSIPTSLRGIEAELERSAANILAEFAVDACEKFIGKEADGRLHLGYAIRRGNDFILIRKLYAPTEGGAVEASDERWTLEIDNRVVGDEYRSVADAMDAASIGGRAP